MSSLRRYGRERNITTSQQLEKICSLQEVELKRFETILYSLQFIQQEYKIEPIFIFDV